jgi:hypothetical protein
MAKTPEHVGPHETGVAIRRLKLGNFRNRHHFSLSARCRSTSAVKPRGLHCVQGECHAAFRAV